MRSWLLLSVSLGLSALVSGAGAQPGPRGPVAITQKVVPSGLLQQGFDFDEDAEAEKGARARLAVHNARLKPILAADPRVKTLTEQFQEAIKITDARARKARLDALTPQIIAVRSAAMAKLKIDEPQIQTDLAPLRQGWRPRTPQPPPPPPKKEVVTVSSWPLTMAGKTNCTDEADTWDFDGNRVKMHAGSTPADKDCWLINAGRRTATIDVPDGATRVDLAATAKVDLYTAAFSFGFYAKGVAYWGFKILSTEGKTLSTVTINGVQTPLPVAACKIKIATAINTWPNPIPIDIGEYEADLQDGDTGNSCSFSLPAGIKKLDIIMFAGGMADADVLGVASTDAKITPKSVKATFVRP